MTEETEPKELKWLREYSNGRKELRENSFKNNSLPDFAGFDLKFWKKIYEEGKQAGATETTKELQEEIDYQKQARSIAENAVVDCTKEIAELEAQTHAEDYIKSLEAQVEKMKCCGNCQFAEHSILDGTFCHKEGCFTLASRKCKEWELAE